jgi:vacuolar-type H+-ATPase subunit E/Vma4
LFHEQCSRWQRDQARSGIQRRIQQSLDSTFQAAKEELDKILQDEKAQLITYNHYYTDNIQNAREDAAKEKLQNSMDQAIAKDWNGKLHVSNTAIVLQKISSS